MKILNSPEIFVANVLEFDRKFLSLSLSLSVSITGSRITLAHVSFLTIIANVSTEPKVHI